MRINIKEQIKKYRISRKTSAFSQNNRDSPMGRKRKLEIRGTPSENGQKREKTAKTPLSARRNPHEVRTTESIDFSCVICRGKGEVRARRAFFLK